MTKTIRAALACGLAAALAACSGSSSDKTTPPAAGPTLSLSATTVTFPATVSAGTLPAAQAVTVTNSGTGTLAAPTATVAAGGEWLDATVVTSGAGFTISLRPNTTALAAQAHATAVQVVSAGAAASPASIAVSWQITPNANPVIAASPAALSFSAQVGDPDPDGQTFTVVNGGSGSLAPSVAADVAWLTPTLAGSTVTVAAALGALARGDHAGHVNVTSAGAVNSPLAVPVTFHVLEPALDVTTATLTFAAAPGATAAEQTRAIGNSGTGTLRIVTATPSDPWIATSVTGTGNTRTLHVSVTAPATEGTYDGSVVVASASTTGGPVTIPVHLVVSASLPVLSIGATSSLTFTTTAGTNPAAKVLSVTNGGGGTLAAVTATPSYTSGTGWMTATVTGSGNSQTVTVSITAPAAGSYAGALSIAAAGAANSPLSIPVSLTVSPTSSGGTATPAGGVIAMWNANSARDAACFKSYIRSVPEWTATRDAMAASVQAAVTAGRRTYSQANADACIAWVQGASCAEYDYETWTPACDAVFVGQVQNGNSCSDDTECANGYCVFGSTCPGTCTAFKATNATCSAEEQCGPGKACFQNTTCQPLTPVGGDGQACSNGAPECALGYFCNGSTCTAKLSAGATCDPVAWGQCAAGLECIDVGAGAFKCTAFVGQGASCAAAPCGFGLHCAASTKTCVAWPVVGEDCTETETCQDGSYCLGTTTRVCTAGTVAAGATCSTPTPTSSASTLCAQQAGSRWVSCVPPAGGGSSTCEVAIFDCN